MKEWGLRGSMEPPNKSFTPFTIEDILSRPQGSPPQLLGTRGSPPQLLGTRGSPTQMLCIRGSPPQMLCTRGSPPQLLCTRGSPPQLLNIRRSPPQMLRSRGSHPQMLGTRGRPPQLLRSRGSPPQLLRSRGSPPQSASPLCALEELASKTFRGLEMGVLQAADGHEPLGSFGHRPSSKKRRKSRTAFTNHQIYELEKRFIYQKYLSPADRDHIAQQLGLSNAQVITWFQNRRAKMKRDLEEMKADVESMKKLPSHALEKLVSMPDDRPEKEDEEIGPCSPTSQGLFFQSSQSSSMEHTINEFSDEEIEVDN
ncbi:transcription factor LBX2 [Dendrobates tinctorius]|uniref:transcription factor LBX2 n=1 Tax=Dendrobates tinctorius TaxID=92724 RepID=UPI003CC9CDAB